MRLQPARVCSLHILTNTGDTASIHHIVSQSSLFKQVLKVRTIDGVGDGLRQFCAYFWALAVTDRLNQEVSKRPALELNFSEHVENLAAKGLAGLLQFLEQGAVNVTLPGFRSYQVPKVAYLGLSDAVDTA